MLKKTFFLAALFFLIVQSNGYAQVAASTESSSVPAPVEGQLSADINEKLSDVRVQNNREVRKHIRERHIFAWQGDKCPIPSEEHKGPETQIAKPSGVIYCFLRISVYAYKTEPGRDQCPSGTSPFSREGLTVPEGFIWCIRDEAKQNQNSQGQQRRRTRP